MAPQQPAVVIVARHGMRLDASDQKWHLSTPTPYDPPITYGGWTQCRALGQRIADLLHRREEEGASDVSSGKKGVLSYDFARSSGSGSGGQGKDGEEERPRKRRRLRHKVVIHTSPFLRCLQTSVAISAGMAQYNPTIESTGGGGKRTPTRTYPASASLHAKDGYSSPKAAPNSEPEQDLAHPIAHKTLDRYKHRHRKSKLRIDAFLGEWLNPSYFESITPPPPSAMMVTTAKAEMMEQENVDIFTPAAASKLAADSSLWAGGANSSRPVSKEGALDDLSTIQDDLPIPSSPTRSRASTVQTGSMPQSSLPLTSTLPKQESTIYHPPQPHYAVSSSSQIPRGYVAHARNACTDVDYAWDSSRPPQDWGDGGEFGESWSGMHKRLRRGFSGLVKWYSTHELEDKGKDSLGIDQAGHENVNGHAEEDEEREDLVVILVTHGADCNALIGALSGQPVLLDVGMASLTMAVQRDDAPPTATHDSETEPHASTARRGSLDIGLSSIYDIKLLASTDHLRPAASPSMKPKDSTKDKFRDHLTADPPRSNTSSALGTIRRPSAMHIAAASADRSSSMPPTERLQAPISSGLWTPPSVAGKSPLWQAQARVKEEEPPSLDLGGTSTPTSQLSTTMSNGKKDTSPTSNGMEGQVDGSQDPTTHDSGRITGTQMMNQVAHDLNRVTTAHKESGLWSSKPPADGRGRQGHEPKRRWTVDRET